MRYDVKQMYQMAKAGDITAEDFDKADNLSRQFIFNRFSHTIALCAIDKLNDHALGVYKEEFSAIINKLVLEAKDFISQHKLQEQDLDVLITGIEYGIKDKFPMPTSLLQQNLNVFAMQMYQKFRWRDDCPREAVRSAIRLGEGASKHGEDQETKARLEVYSAYDQYHADMDATESNRFERDVKFPAEIKLFVARERSKRTSTQMAEEGIKATEWLIDNCDDKDKELLLKVADSKAKLQDMVRKLTDMVGYEGLVNLAGADFFDGVDYCAKHAYQDARKQERAFHGTSICRKLAKGFDAQNIKDTSGAAYYAYQQGSRHISNGND